MQDGRHQISESILKKLEAVSRRCAHTWYPRSNLPQLFVERPVWTRMSLFSQFSAAEARDILKYPYTFSSDDNY